MKARKTSARAACIPSWSACSTRSASRLLNARARTSPLTPTTFARAWWTSSRTRTCHAISSNNWVIVGVAANSAQRLRPYSESDRRSARCSSFVGQLQGLGEKSHQRAQFPAPGNEIRHELRPAHLRLSEFHTGEKVLALQIPY